MNVLLTSAGRRSYLAEYFKEALAMAGRGGLVHAAKQPAGAAFPAADRQAVTPLIYEEAYLPFLLDYCRREDIGMVVPLFDIDVPVLAASRQAFEAAGDDGGHRRPGGGGSLQRQMEDFSAAEGGRHRRSGVLAVGGGRAGGGPNGAGGLSTDGQAPMGHGLSVGVPGGGRSGTGASLSGKSAGKSGKAI